MSAPGSGSPSRMPPEALRQLLAQRPQLMAFIVSMVRDFALADEFFQDLCVVVCERWDEFPKDADFGAWTREIARRRTFALLRARGKSAPPPLTDAALDEIEKVHRRDAAQLAATWEKRKAALRACLKGVPGRLRQVLDLRYTKNLSPNEIAAQLNLPLASVLETLAQGRGEMKSGLERRLRAEGGPA